MLLRKWVSFADKNMKWFLNDNESFGLNLVVDHRGSEHRWNWLTISHRVEVDVEIEASGAPNDDFLPNALKTLF